MSDTALALLITILVLLALAAWVPLLHAAETLTIRRTKHEAASSPQAEESVAHHKAA